MLLFKENNARLRPALAVFAAIVFLAAAAHGASANFIKSDALTQGNWQGVYGADGYSVSQVAESLPDGVTMAFAGHQNHTWAASTSEARALAKPTSGRIAACWYNNVSYTLTITVDGQQDVAMYLLDWDTSDRRQHIDVRDADTNALLDTRSVTQSYRDGLWLIWSVSGAVRFEFFRDAGHNAVLSGVFFDNSAIPFLRFASQAYCDVGLPLTLELTCSEGTATTVSVDTPLPPGLHYDEGNRLIYGTPTEVGAFDIDVTAVDAVTTNTHEKTLTLYVQNRIRTRGLLWEWWTGISGNTVAQLTDHASYPDSPSGSEILPVFEPPVNWSDNYGSRIRGYVHPPVTGDYTFWIASDDHSALYLSPSGGESADAVQIVNLPTNVSYRTWSQAAQKSDPVALQAGVRYYIEARHKEGTGADHVSVRWQLPDGAIEEPIGAQRLSPWTDTCVIRGTAGEPLTAYLPVYIGYNTTSTVTGLPAGLVSDGKHMISGTVNTQGVYNVTFSASDSVTGLSVSNKQLTIEIWPTLPSRTGYWPFSEGSGSETEGTVVLPSTMQVSSVSATLAGTLAPNWALGQEGGALSFQNGFAETNVSASQMELAGAGPWTIAMWAKTDEFVSGGRLFEFRSSPQALRLETTAVFGGFQIVGRDKSITFTDSSAFGQWVHIAATYDGKLLRLYADGVLQSSTPVTLDVGGNLRIGEGYRGALDEFQVFNRAFDAAELEEWVLAKPLVTCLTIAPFAFETTGGSSSSVQRITRFGNTASPLVVDLDLDGTVDLGSLVLSSPHGALGGSGALRTLEIPAFRDHADLLAVSIDDGVETEVASLQVTILPSPKYYVGRPSNSTAYFLDHTEGTGGLQVEYRDGSFFTSLLHTRLDNVDLVGRSFEGFSLVSPAVIWSGGIYPPVTGAYKFILHRGLADYDYLTLEGAPVTLAAVEPGVYETAETFDLIAGQYCEMTLHYRDSTGDEAKSQLHWEVDGQIEKEIIPAECLTPVRRSTVSIVAVQPEASGLGQVPAVFRVSRDRSLGNIRVRIELGQSSVAQPEDFSSFPEFVTIECGETTAEFDVMPVPALPAAGDKPFVIDVLPGNEYAVSGSAGSASGTIADSQVLWIEPVEPYAYESGEADGLLKVGRTLPQQAATFRLTAHSSGTASPADYALYRGSSAETVALDTDISWPAGEDEFLIRVVAADDGVSDNGIETLVVSVGPSGMPDCAIDPSRAEGTVSIVDAQTVSLRVTALVELVEEDSSDSGVIVIERLGGNPLAVVNATIETVTSGLSHPASYSADYTLSSGPGMVQIPDGATQILVTPIYDPEPERDETVRLKLTSSDAVVDPDAVTADVLILDNDKPIVSVAATVAAAVEGGTSGEFTLSRMGNVRSPLTVSVTYGGDAVMGVDYSIAPSGTSITIPAGQESLTLSVSAIEDAIQKADRLAVIEIAAGSLYSLSATDVRAKVAIVDNDMDVVLGAFDLHATSSTKETNQQHTFTWDVPSGSPINYTLQVSEHSDFEPLLWSAQFSTASGILPRNVLTTGEAYYARVIAYKSPHSRASASVRSFTAVDTIPPVLESHLPAEGSTGVRKNASIRLTFSEPIAAGVAATAVSLWPEAALNVSVQGLDVVFSPKTSLAYSTTYVVTVHSGEFTDLAGLQLATDTQFSFTTEAPSSAGCAASSANGWTLLLLAVVCLRAGRGMAWDRKTVTNIQATATP